MKPRSLSQRLAAWREDARHKLEAEWRDTQQLKQWHKKSLPGLADFLTREPEPIEYRAAADPALSLEDFVSFLSVDPASVLWEGRTLAHAAAGAGDLEKLCWLVEHGVDPNLPDRYGGTPLTIAAGGRRLASADIFQYLISLGAKPKIQSKVNASALSSSLAVGRFDIARELIAAGADPLECAFSPLHQAAAWKDNPTISAVAAQTGSLEARDERWRTPWLVAVHAGRVEAAACLKSLGAKTSVATSGGETAMDLAAEGDHPKMIRYLFGTGHSIAAASRFAGVIRSPLSTAVTYDSVAAAKTLLRLGARFTPQAPIVNQVIGEAWSPRMLELLYSYGADLDFIADFDYWPLKHLVEEGNFEGVEWLLNHGAKVDNCREFWGATALFQAVYGNHLKIAALLLERGANPSAVDGDGDTPLSSCITPSMENLLLSYGAKTWPWK